MRSLYQTLYQIEELVSCGLNKDFSQALPWAPLDAIFAFPYYLLFKSKLTGFTFYIKKHIVPEANQYKKLSVIVEVTLKTTIFSTLCVLLYNFESRSIYMHYSCKMVLLRSFFIRLNKELVQVGVTRVSEWRTTTTK